MTTSVTICTFELLLDFGKDSFKIGSKLVITEKLLLQLYFTLDFWEYFEQFRTSSIMSSKKITLA